MTKLDLGTLTFLGAAYALKALFGFRPPRKRSKRRWMPRPAAAL